MIALINTNLILLLVLLFLVQAAIVWVVASRYFKKRQELNQQKQDRLLKRAHLHRNELSSEKEKALGLVRSVLPLEVAEELINTGTVTPKLQRRVTVMFTDFVNFTQISENMRARNLVEELNFYFSKFDEIIAHHNVQKIKTVGDAYMCAGGVPISNNSNPIDVVLAAFEIQQFMHDLRQEREANGESIWDIRIGINTGEAITGVAGKRRLAFDIWGDTVNLASRMEIGGEPGKVNISESTYEYVKDFFECTYRGKLEAKNKGMVDMYFVDRIKPELSRLNQGLRANHVFYEELSMKYNQFINYKKMEVYILQRLEQGLPKDLYYHSVQHTRDVHDAVERIAHAERINREDMLLLKTAALYHDAGFLNTYLNNEPHGAELAADTLGNFGYNREQIQVICDMILATAIPQTPTNYLQEILCDADLDYLGRDDFPQIGDKLKSELMARNMISTDREWDEMQVRFLKRHKYFTATSRNLRQTIKQRNLEQVEKRLEAGVYEV